MTGKNDLENCEEVAEELKKWEKTVRNILGVSEEDFRILGEAWTSLSEEERKEITGNVLEKLLGSPGLVGDSEREFTPELLAEMMETICCSEGGDMAVNVFLGSVRAVSMGLSLGAILLLVSSLLSLLAEKAGGEKVLNIARVLSWCQSVIVESYLLVRNAVLSRASGVSPKVLDNLVRAYSRDLLERAARVLGSG